MDITKTRYKTSEWVSLGHPDKTADYISSYILDRVIELDKRARYAVECQIKDNNVTLAGEMTTTAEITKEMLKEWAQDAVNDVGYTKEYQSEFGKEATICGDDIIVHTFIARQSPDIAQGVDKDAWGDQGIFFGYYCDETPQGQGIEYQKAKEVGKELYEMAHSLKFPIGIDIKTQATVAYDEEGKYNVVEFICAVPVKPGHDLKEIKKLVNSVLLEVWPEAKGCNLIVNGTGAYYIHGPVGDSGTTGRKLVVDFYGSRSRIGGGCVDSETEYLSEDGWKKISEYKGGKVGQLNDKLELEMVTPERYIDTFHKDVYEISTGKTTNMVLSGNHNVLYKTSKGHLRKKTLSQILAETGKTKKGSHIDVPVTFNYYFSEGKKTKYDELTARIIVAHCADGTVLKNGSKKWNCRIRVKKTYKISRLRDLFIRSGKKYEEREYSDGYTYFYYSLKNTSKLLSEQFKNPDFRTAKILSEEVYKWYGSEMFKEYRTTKKEDADFVQFVLSGFTGKSHSIIRKEKKEGYSDLYIVRETQKACSNPFRKNGKNKIVKKEPQRMYCFTVPSGMLLLRRNRYIFCTANSPWTKDASKADLTLNLYAHKVAQMIFENKKDNSEPVAWVETELSCCIGKNLITMMSTAYDQNGVPISRDTTRIKIKPSQLIRQFKLDTPIFATLCREGLFYEKKE